jgi:hypothetical protein
MPIAFKWTLEELQDMVTSYKQGETAQSIAKRYGTSHHVIIHVIMRQGVKLRSRHESHYGHNRHTFDAYHFHLIDTEEKAYWLGFLTADGCITIGKKLQDSPRISIHLGKQDYEHLVKFKQALQASQIVSINAHSCSFTICSSRMAADLASHGILPKKTRSTKPTQIAPELARHYWRGVIDGDGCIAARRKDITLVGDYEVVLAFQTFVLAHCPKVKASVFRKENIYTFNITGDAARRMLDVLYGDATVYLERKYQLARRM